MVRVSKDELRRIINRIENVENQINDLKADRKQIYDEAKGTGYDSKILRRIVSIRRKSAEARAEEEALLETYLEALNGV